MRLLQKEEVRDKGAGAEAIQLFMLKLHPTPRTQQPIQLFMLKPWRALRLLGHHGRGIHLDGVGCPTTRQSCRDWRRCFDQER